MSQTVSCGFFLVVAWAPAFAVFLVLSGPCSPFWLMGIRESWCQNSVSGQVFAGSFGFESFTGEHFVLKILFCIIVESIAKGVSGFYGYTLGSSSAWLVCVAWFAPKQDFLSGILPFLPLLALGL